MKFWQKFLLCLLCVSAVFVVHGSSLASDPDDYDPSATGNTGGQCAWGFLEVPFPGFQNKSICDFINTACPLRSYAALLANFLIAATVGVGVIMIVLGGYVYMTAGGNASRVSTAKTMIGAALLGIILALATFLILRTVNPDILTGACPISGTPGAGDDDTYNAQIVSPSSHSRTSNTVVGGTNLPVQVDLRAPNGDPATSVKFFVDDTEVGEQVLGITDSAPLEEAVAEPSVLGISNLDELVDTSGLEPGTHVLKILMTTESGLTITQEVEFEVLEFETECIDKLDNDFDGLIDCGYGSPDDLPLPGYPPPQYYDVNGDGVVSAADAEAVRAFVSDPLNPEELPRGSIWQNPGDLPWDVDNDGDADEDDALLIDDPATGHIARHATAYGDSSFPEPGDPQCYGAFQEIPNPFACDPSIDLEDIPPDPAAEIDITGGGFTIGSGDTTPDPSDGTDFGDISGGAPDPITKTFLIHNAGEEDLLLNPGVPVAISGASNFRVATQPPSVISDGDSVPFVVEMTSGGSDGVKSATVSIANNDADENPYTFDLRGTVTAPPAPEMDLYFGLTPVADGDSTPTPSEGTDFGTSVVGSGAVAHEFTVRNSGSPFTTVQIKGNPLPYIKITGTGASAFTASPPIPLNISPPPSQQGRFTISFDPSAAGDYIAQVTINNNDDDENPYNFTISGRAIELNPEIEIVGNGEIILNGDTDPQPLDGTDFGSAIVSPLAPTTSNTFGISNIGAADLDLTGTPAVAIGGDAASDFTIDVTHQPTGPVGPASTASFIVEFAPSAIGLRTAVVSIANSDDDEDPYTFVIQGTGTAAEPEMILTGKGQLIDDGDSSPTTSDGTDFGSIDVGTNTLPQDFTITNTGLGDLTLSNITLGGDIADFTVISQPPGTVASSGGTGTFSIQFNPISDGTRTATVSIDNNDSDENPYNFVIQGSGIVVEPEIEVKGKGVLILDGDTSPSAADGTLFGTFDVGTSSPPATFDIGNVGQAALSLGSNAVTLSGSGASHFSIQSQPETSVPTGETRPFSIVFQPSADGVHTAKVSIANDDSNENPYDFDIQGTGYTPTPEIGILGKSGIAISTDDLSPTTADGTNFGLQEINTTSPVTTFTIENTGDAPLNLTGGPPITIIGHSGDFVVTQPTTPIPANGGTATFTVAFRPTAQGARGITLSILNNDPDDNENPYVFAISGTGELPDAPEITMGFNSPTGPPTTQVLTNETIPVVWTVTNANTCTATHSPVGVPSWSGSVSATGDTINVSSASPGLYILDLRCDGDFGLFDTDSVQLQVVDPVPEIGVTGKSNRPISNNDTFPSTLDGTEMGTLASNVEIRHPQIVDDNTFDFTAPGWEYRNENTTPDLNEPHEAYRRDLHHSREPFNSGEIATWTFDTIAGADYQVATHWRPHSNRSDNARYVVKSGATTLGTTVVNQRSTPSSYQHDNQSWEDLGTFRATTSTLTVELADSGMACGPTNCFLIADAVRIEQLTPGTPQTKQQTFRVHNTGTAPLNVTGVTIQGASTGDFSITSQPPATINPGTSAPFTVQFAPQGIGERVATVRIANNDSDENPYTFTVRGCADACTSPEPLQIMDDGDQQFVHNQFETYWSPNENKYGYQHDVHFLWNESDPTEPHGARATWNFDVEPGEYQVSMTWVEFTNRPTNAPFKIFDGGTEIRSLQINQKIAPNPDLVLPNPSHPIPGSTRPFQHLGPPVTINSTQLVVETTNDIEIPSAVIADAVRIERIASSQIFATSSSTFSGQLGTLSGADGQCRTHAQNAGLPNPTSYKAVLSDSTTDARDHIASAAGTGAIRRIDGSIFATSISQMWSGNVLEPVGFFENGDPVPLFGGVLAWTGTAQNGTKSPLGLYCGDGSNDWNSLTGQGSYGNATESGAGWIESNGGNSCNAGFRLYCIGSL